MKSVKVVSFSLMLIIILVWANGIIMYKSPYGITQYKGFYEQEKDSVDVLFIGTSHVYSDIDPAYVYDECGVLSYDLATGGASIPASYYSIRQALEVQHPDVIAVELYGITRYALEQREIVDATYGIRNPAIKYASLKENIGDNSLLEFYMAFPWYHSLYNDVNRSDFKGYDYIQSVGTKTYLYHPERLQSYKGATILSCTTPDMPLDVPGVETECKIHDKAEVYLNKIIQLCEEENIKLCFFVSPFSGVTKTFSEQINYIKNHIAEPKNINLIDANKYVQDIGIDWNTDAAESSHLNYKGAKKYSKWLGRQLADLYGLKDCHGMAAADSWEENLNWENEVYLIFDLLERDRIEDNLNIWKQLDADVFLSFHGDKWEAYKEIFLHSIGVDEEAGKIADGLARIDGAWKIHYAGEEKMVREEGIDAFSICSSEQGSVINHNGSDMLKVQDGVDIVVYDRYIQDTVDHAAFTGVDELNCIRKYVGIYMEDMKKWNL